MNQTVHLPVVLLFGVVLACAGSKSDPNGVDELSTTGPPTGGGSGMPTGGGGPGAGTGGGGGDAQFYFVLHADPAIGPTLQTNWTRLTDFMKAIKDRNDTLETPHKVTILFSPTWGDLIGQDTEKQKTVGKWIQAGHEMGFHSHTTNHAKRDGYSNHPDWQKDDATKPDKSDSMCSGADCSLDHGLSLVQAALDAAHGGPYDIKWARVGGEGNGGPDCPAGTNDNQCDPAQSGGEPVADCCGCVDKEWTGAVNTTVNYSTIGTIDPGGDADDPHTLLTASTCRDWAGAAEDVYALAHAPYETETGWRVRTLDVIEQAFAAGGAGDHIGLVIHPGSFDAATQVSPPSRQMSCSGGSKSTPAAGAPDKRTHILALFAAAEAAGYTSVTLSEARAADSSGGGDACRDLR